MKFKIVAIILLLSLFLFFVSEKISANENKKQSTNIAQINILKYAPENNKLLFISNLESYSIIDNFEKDIYRKNKDKFVLVKNSILNYLGIDLGKNKLKDIYDNELIISTTDKNKKTKDDILIVFKIKPEKNLDEILNLGNQIDHNNEIVSIYRENKLNYLKFIYQTEDNYIIASSDKELIKDVINSSKDYKDRKFQYESEILGLKNHKNILFTKKFGESIFLNNEIFPERSDDTIVTTFDLKNKNLVLKSYLVNKEKNIDLLSYENLIREKNKNNDTTSVSIFSDMNIFDKYLKPLINDFEKSFFEDFNQKETQNIFIINSSKDWLIAFEKNTEDQFVSSDIEKLKDFNKYSLKQNEDIYSIYSKEILEKKDDIIKKLTYENIYSIESGDLQIISNYLVDGKKLEKISNKFSNLKSNKDKSTFLYAKVDIKNTNPGKLENFSDLEDFNFLIKNILKISNEEILEIIKQSIPEKNPIFYKEKSLEIMS